ncbi:hypothetical protein HED60_16265 [Planctomycetales bacterium ZRK34]|nr:hypothetical protein HED60_16265 [Planctomycetales bacterium ZRK34]
MSQLPDDFQDLAQAASKPGGRRSAKGGGAKAAQYRRIKRKKSLAGPLAAGLALTLMIAAVVVLVKNRPMEQTAPQPEPEVESNQPDLPQVATPRQKDIYEELTNIWQTLRDTPRTGRFGPLMDTADKAYTRADALWKSGKYYEFQDYYATVSDALGAVEKMRLAKQQALDTQEKAAAARGEAEDLDAAVLAKATWEKAESLNTSGKQNYDAEEFDKAVADWLEAITTYQDAETRSQTAMDAEDTRKNFVRKSTGTFKTEELDAHGGQPWTKANALIASGDKAYKAVQYDKALSDFKQAVALVPEFERAVQRVYGRNVWALRTGYLATDALLTRAGGAKFEPEAKKALVASFADLAMDQTIGAALPTDAAPYAQWAGLLLERAPQQLGAAYGDNAVRSYTIGVHLRLLARMLQEDREALDPHDLAEMRKSLSTIQQEAESAKYDPAFLERLDEIVQSLNVKPVFEAVRLTREKLTSLVEDLTDYEKALKLVPRGSK